MPKRMHVVKGTVGRPPVVFDEKDIQQIETLAAVLNQKQIADFLGIGDRTLRTAIKENEEVSAAYKRGKANAIKGVATSLLNQARNGNVTAAIFYLKTQAKWQEVDRLQVEDVTDGGDNPADTIVGELDRIKSRQAGDS